MVTVDAVNDVVAAPDAAVPEQGASQTVATEDVTVTQPVTSTTAVTPALTTTIATTITTTIATTVTELIYLPLITED